MGSHHLTKKQKRKLRKVLSVGADSVFKDKSKYERISNFESLVKNHQFLVDNT